MKLPTYYWHIIDKDRDSVYEFPGIGVEWWSCRESPSWYFERPDKDYYDYLHLKFKFGYKWLCIDLYYKKMPYRNMAEYKLFRKYFNK